MLLRGLGPLEDYLYLRAVLAHQREYRIVHGLRAPLGQDLPEEIGDTVLVPERLIGTVSLVDEPHLDPTVQEARDLQPIPDSRRIELGAGEDGGVRLEEDGGAGSPRGAELLRGPDRATAPKLDLPFGAVALHGGDQLRRERVDDRGAHAMEASRRLLAAGIELSTGVQGRKDDLEGGPLVLGMLVDRDPAPVVDDGDAGPVLVKGHDDLRRVPVHRFVDRVIYYLPHQVMEPRAADAPDIHAGPLANRLEPFENRDVFGGVLGGHGESHADSKAGGAGGASPTTSLNLPRPVESRPLSAPP